MAGHCVVQADCGNGIRFIGRNGCDTSDLQQALIFEDELAVHLFIDEHGLDRLARVRKIVPTKTEHTV
ncbi:MAG: hypothetical protein LUI06_01195 [Ruminococcus sp.]|nr:hypothetical protein [Ruminococcus sp.]